MDIDDALTASHVSTLTDKEVRGEGERSYERRSGWGELKEGGREMRALRDCILYSSVSFSNGHNLISHNVKKIISHTSEGETFWWNL
jgi:hypothetical protein